MCNYRPVTLEEQKFASLPHHRQFFDSVNSSPFEFTMAKGTEIKHQYVSCPNGCLTAKGVASRHRDVNNCPRVRNSVITNMKLSGNAVSLKILTIESEQRSESASNTASNDNSSPPVPAVKNSASTKSTEPIVESPSGFTSELGQLTLPMAQSPEIPLHVASEQRQVTQGTISSKPFLNIPGTPDTIAPDSSCRVLGSPVKPMRDLNHDWLDPNLRREISSSKPSIDGESVVDSTSTVDTEEKPLSDIPLDDDDVKEISKAKRPRLNKDTVTFQEDDNIRTSYFRTTSERYKDNLKVLGVYTGCIGILYLHR